MAKAPANKGSSLLQRVLATSTIDDTNILNDSVFFEPKDAIHTGVVLVDVGLSGLVDGGLYPGLTLFAGKSKSFKTAFSLLCGAAFLKKNPDGVILFYDSEFGTPQSYFDTFGIDRSRVIHTPITNIEILKHDVVNQLTALERGDKVMVIIDSIGNLASKKETDDAMEGKSVADMSRAKAIKSLFRMVTPHLMMKGIPMIAINHTYDCGTENMLVITEDGPVSLKDISVGDTVLTTSGYEKVSYKVDYENAPITDIELEDGTLLSFTPGHRFKVNGEWVFVEDLKEGMVLDTV